MAKTLKIFDEEKLSKLLTNDLKIIHLNKIQEHESLAENIKLPLNLDLLEISKNLACSFCKINFEDVLVQRQHYKSDWHRYNLKLNLKSLQPITEDDFEKITDDVSSISGSDTDEDSEPDTSLNSLYQGKIFLKNSEKIFGVFRSLLHEKKDFPTNEDFIIKLVKQAPRKIFWTIVMIGGGHFAGAVYEGDKVLVHKTFHLYTCRAKQGGAQYKEGSARSAGASLRRYNELSLNQHVAELLQNWSQYIEKSHLIFYRAAGPFNRTALFGGKAPTLKKNDTRLRTIPFCTKRPTFTELKRVHDLLTNVDIYDSIDEFKNHFKIDKLEENRQSRRESPVKNKNINRAKSRESKESIRPVPGLIGELVDELIDQISNSSMSDSDLILDSNNQEISFEGLRESGGTKRPPRKKKLSKKDRIKKWEEQLKRDLNNACIKGDIETVKFILGSIQPEGEQLTPEKALNVSVDEAGNTVLHVAALNNHNELIFWLLENNSSPCNKNDKLQTPYTINSDKSVRGIFRDFAAKNPDKYNYPKSQIPVVTTTLTEEEISEKKKAQRKAKRDREKEKKKENEIKRKEEEEKNRYLKLSDREKRALAAERRMLAQTAKVLVRCFLCGEDISGKVPFEYSGNRFCSISCLKAHRLQTPIVLS